MSPESLPAAQPRAPSPRLLPHHHPQQAFVYFLLCLLTLTPEVLTTLSHPTLFSDEETKAQGGEVTRPQVTQLVEVSQASPNSLPPRALKHPPQAHALGRCLPVEGLPGRTEGPGVGAAVRSRVVAGHRAGAGSHGRPGARIATPSRTFWRRLEAPALGDDADEALRGRRQGRVGAAQGQAGHRADTCPGPTRPACAARRRAPRPCAAVATSAAPGRRAGAADAGCAGAPPPGPSSSVSTSSHNSGSWRR